MSDRDLTPTFIARCRDCGGLMAASVADMDSPNLVEAVKHREAWRRAGALVETVTVQAVREWPGKLGHRDGCPKAKPKRRTPAQPEAGLFP